MTAQGPAPHPPGASHGWAQSEPKPTIESTPSSARNAAPNGDQTTMLNTTHNPMPTAGAPGMPAPPATGAVLRLLVKGFSAMEHRLLEGTVKLSQRRAPRIDLVSEADGQLADVVMIDAQDMAAVQWANTQPWLLAKAVIWAGAKAVRPGHLAIDRHVKWPILPVLLYRALDGAPAQAAPATLESATPRPANRRVLVVDDSLAVRNYLRSL